MNYKTDYSSPLGSLLLTSDGLSITGLWMEGQKYYLGGMGDELTDNNELPVFLLTRHWLDDYFGKKLPKITDIPLSPHGSEFRRGVWKILCEIPYGKTMTYGEIAARITQSSGKTTSARAVGGAVGHNPISIIIPCHRVIGRDGSLTGYAGGVSRKRQLLELEGVKLQ